MKIRVLCVTCSFITNKSTTSASRIARYSHSHLDKLPLSLSMSSTQLIHACASDPPTGMPSKHEGVLMSCDEQHDSSAEVHDHLFIATDESAGRRTSIHSASRRALGLTPIFRHSQMRRHPLSTWRIQRRTRCWSHVNCGEALASTLQL